MFYNQFTKNFITSFKMPNLESTYNEVETDCYHLLEILQDKVLNLKKSGKTWGNVAELNRLKVELNEAKFLIL